MTAGEGLPYEVEDVEVVAETDDLKVRLFTLAAGQVIPWHYHSSVADIFVGLEGVTLVEAKAPRGHHELAPGQHCLVPAKTAHRVSGRDGGPCRFALTQGVVHYDFVANGEGS